MPIEFAPSHEKEQADARLALPCRRTMNFGSALGAVHPNPLLGRYQCDGDVLLQRLEGVFNEVS
jgi:hypothetical protein